jgi:AAA domain
MDAQRRSRQVSDASNVTRLPLRPRKSNDPLLFSVMSEKEIRQRAQGDDDMLVKGLLPSEGFGLLYGLPKAFKSFTAIDLCYRVANGRAWAGRAVKQGAAVYIAAEGAAGIPKRVEGAIASLGTGESPFFLIAAAPNLGSQKGDLSMLVASIESAGIAPSIIVIDTLSQCLGGNDENGSGMIAFTRNALALAKHFGTFVLALHHPGLYNEDRPRGHTSLTGAADVQILASRLPDGFSTALTVQKAKDMEDGYKLTATMRRHGSTLVVDRIEDGVDPRHEREAKAKTPSGAVLWARAFADVVKEHGPEIARDAAKFEDLHRDRFYALNGGSADSNRQSLNRGRHWLIGKGRLQIDAAGIALKNVA